MFLALSVVASAALGQSGNAVVKNPETLHRLACANPQTGGSPWYIGNLYDCDRRTIFIPYQLWTGAKWNGDKNSPCMHRAKSTFYVNGTSGTTINGPKEWNNRQIWVRDKIRGSKTQYFECHDKGIGRVYEIRKGKEKLYRRTGRCKFPGGYGWEFSKKRYCTNTAVEIDRIKLDDDRNLYALEFKWWYKSRSGKYVLDHRYRYVRNTGSTNAWPQR